MNPVDQLAGLVGKPLGAVSKAMNRPSCVMLASSLPSLPWMPPELTLTLRVILVQQSWTKTSFLWFVSAGTRSFVSLSKATKRPLREATG